MGKGSLCLPVELMAVEDSPTLCQIGVEIFEDTHVGDPQRQRVCANDGGGNARHVIGRIMDLES